MIPKRSKTNWTHVLIVAIFAVTGGESLFLQYKSLLNELAAWESPIATKPVPLPTEIDRNFITQVNQCFIPTAAVYGYTLRITSGFRSMAEQDELFEQGRTVNGHIVSWAPSGRSLHNYGFAVDVVDRWKGYNINWKKLAKISAYCGLEQVDDPHFEHRSGLTTHQFAMGIRPPPLILPCTDMSERATANQPLTIKDLENCKAPNF